MERFNADQLSSWMNGTLIRRMNALPVDEIVLDGNVRIAAFDENWQLRNIQCRSVCPLGELRRRGLSLYAIEQDIKELHFALCQLSDYTLGSGRAFRFGANLKVSVRAGSALSLRPLLVRVQRLEALTLADAYEVIQPSLEQLWREEIAKRCWAGWTQAQCFDVLRRMQDEVGTQMDQLFRQHGLICSSGIRLQGISEPLYMQDL